MTKLDKQPQGWRDRFSDEFIGIDHFSDIEEFIAKVRKEAILQEQNESYLRGFIAACHNFSPSGLCGEPSPEKGLSIKQYINKWEVKLRVK